LNQNQVATAVMTAFSLDLANANEWQLKMNGMNSLIILGGNKQIAAGPPVQLSPFLEIQKVDGGAKAKRKGTGPVFDGTKGITKDVAAPEDLKYKISFDTGLDAPALGGDFQIILGQGLGTFSTTLPDNTSPSQATSLVFQALSRAGFPDLE